MRDLAAPATPDQIEQRATLVSHLTIITDPMQGSPERIWLGGPEISPPARCSYNSHMQSVNIAELKNRLSAYLQQVRAGEEIVIRDRNLPIAKLTPLSSADATEQELAL